MATSIAIGLTVSALLAASSTILLAPDPSPAATVAATDPRLALRDGQLWLAGQPLTGVVVSFHPDGSRATHTTYRHGRRHGQARSWFPDGGPETLRRYRDGRKVGRHLGWWPDGGRRFVARFVQGEQHGELRSWYASGATFEERHFVGGQESGTQRTWTAAGRPLANYVVRDGRRYGRIGGRLCATVRGRASS